MMVTTGETDPTTLAMMGDGVLGHTWDPTLDQFTFSLTVNISKKTKQGIPTGPDLSPRISTP